MALGTRTDVEAPEDGAGSPPRLPALGPLGLARWAWRQLTSMRTALLLLLLLAVAAVPGSLLPQRSVDPSRVTDYLASHASLGPWLDRFGFFDVYTSVWFSAVYLLLFVSLVGCVLPRSRQHWRAVRSRPPRTPARLSRLPEHRRVEVTGASPQDVVAAAAQVLRRRRYRRDVHGSSVAAERGHLRETGNLIFHLSLIGILIAVAAGHLYGYKGQALVVVGDAGFADALPRYDSFEPGARFDPADLPPFSFTLDGLDVKFESSATGAQFGAPREFTAHVTLTPRPGAPAQKRTVEVNHPLSVGGANVYLSGNGYAPAITVRDARGQVTFSGPVPFLPVDGNYRSRGVVKVFGAQPKQLGLIGFLLPTAALDPLRGPISTFPDARNPRLVLTAFAGDLSGSGATQSVYELDTSRMTQLTGPDGQPVRLVLAPGQTVQLPGGNGSVTFDSLPRFAALDIRHDPGAQPALLFAVLAILGLVGSLAVRRRRVWVRAVATDGRTVVELAGLARGRDAGLGAELDQLLPAVLAQAGAVPAGSTTTRQE